MIIAFSTLLSKLLCDSQLQIYTDSSNLYLHKTTLQKCQIYTYICKYKYLF